MPIKGRVAHAESGTPSGRDRARTRALTGLATVEAALAVVVVAADWLLPSLVLVAMAVVSLTLRHAGPASLGLVRPVRARRLVAQMLGVAVVWTLLDVALLEPLTNHLSGQRQDTSDFAALQGDPALLAAYLVLAWVLAAFCEELAFRGYLLTRLAQALGGTRAGIVVAVVVSSATFGMLHTEQGLVGVVISGLSGVLFALLRYRYRTLWAPILAHGFVDTIGFVWFFLFGPLYGLW